MIRLTTIATALLLAAGPLYAQTSTPPSNKAPAGPTATSPGTAAGTGMTTTAQSGCKGEIARADQQISGVKDQNKKDGAMREIGMAKDMMAKNDERGCMTHTQNAMRLMK